MIKLADIKGPNACVAQQCSMTINFLTPFYADAGMPATADAGARDAAPRSDAAPVTTPKHSGCAVGGGRDVPPTAVLLLMLALARAARRRRGGV
jgi:MYXO-CTERM domain-containing protein